MSKRGEWEAMGERITDEMLDAFAIVADLDDVPAQVGQRLRRPWSTGSASNAPYKMERVAGPRSWPVQEDLAVAGDAGPCIEPREYPSRRDLARLWAGEPIGQLVEPGRVVWVGRGWASSWTNTRVEHPLGNPLEKKGRWESRCHRFGGAHPSASPGWWTQRTESGLGAGDVEPREVHGPVKRAPSSAARARGRCDNTLATSQSTISLRSDPRSDSAQHHERPSLQYAVALLRRRFGRADLDVGRPAAALSDLTGALRAPPETAVLWSSNRRVDDVLEEALLVRAVHRALFMPRR